MPAHAAYRPLLTLDHVRRGAPYRPAPALNVAYTAPDDAAMRVPLATLDAAWWRQYGSSDAVMRRRLWSAPERTTPLAEAGVGWHESLRAWCLASNPTAPSRAEDDAMVFADVLVPFANHAYAALRHRAPELDVAFSSAAQADLLSALRARLSRVSARVLYSEFSVRRSLAGHAAVVSALASPNLQYRRFVADMRTGGLESVCTRYPVLGRLLVRAVELWIEAATELVVRWLADRADVQVQLTLDAAHAPVAHVACDAGDAHDGGRTVHILTFMSGERVVYKPRSLGMERGFAALVQWISGRAAVPSLRVPRVIDRGAYGWSEFIGDASAGSTAGVVRFYERAGALLALTHALGGSDFHLENLLACGDDPVLIDLEALLRPQMPFQMENDGSAVEQMQRRVERSVLAIGMLPSLKTLTPESAIDLGGLAVTLTPPSPIRVSRWEAPNTDRMKLIHSTTATQIPTRHIPTLQGRPVPAANFVRDIERGFVRMYDALYLLRGELTAEHGPLDAFAALPLRFLFRNTSLYGALLERTLQPVFLESGVQRSLEFEVLYRPLLQRAEAPALLELVADEIAALEQLDVPLFVARTDSRTLLGARAGPHAAVFACSALQHARNRLAGLSESDRDTQRALLRTAFGAAGIVEGVAIVPARERVPPLRRRVRADPAAVAVALVRRAIASSLVQDATGDVSWLGISYLPLLRRFAVGPATIGLSDGLSGALMATAMVARVTGDATTERTARAIGRALQQRIARAMSAPARELHVDTGLASGTGGVVHALVTASDLLDDHELLSSAEALAAALTMERLATERRGDVATGLAGIVVGLDTLHARTQNDAVLALAVAAATRLHALDWRGQPGGGDNHTLLHGAVGAYRVVAALADRVHDTSLLTDAQSDLAGGSCITSLPAQLMTDDMSPDAVWQLATRYAAGAVRRSWNWKYGALSFWHGDLGVAHGVARMLVSATSAVAPVAADRVRCGPSNAWGSV